MLAIRIAKIALVAAFALHASLIVFGNVTDYGTNLEFVRHVLAMDTIFPSSTIRYRAITDPALQQAAYLLIIAIETAIAVLCWLGVSPAARDPRRRQRLQPSQDNVRVRANARHPALAARLRDDRRRMVRDVDVAPVGRRA